MIPACDTPPPPTSPANRAKHRDSRVRDSWGSVRVRRLERSPLRADAVAAARLEVVVHLERLLPADVRVEAAVLAAADDGDRRPEEESWPIRLSSSRSYHNGSFVFEALLSPVVPGGAGTISVRVRPADERRSGQPLTPVVRRFRLPG
jgi:hypothetical protein